jgi:hypothetical protein
VDLQGAHRGRLQVSHLLSYRLQVICSNFWAVCSQTKCHLTVNVTVTGGRTRRPLHYDLFWSSVRPSSSESNYSSLIHQSSLAISSRNIS